MHGDAIAVGTVIALYFALDRGLLSQSKIDEIVAKMKKHRLNIYIDRNVDINKLVDYMLSDKKSSVDTINLVLLRDIEKPYEENGSLFSLMIKFSSTFFSS